MDRQTRRASEYVNEAAETSSGIYYNDTAESIPEDYDDFVGIATVSPAWYKMALNMPANYWKQPNKRDEYEDYRKPRRIKPPDVKLPLPPRGRRQTREINQSLPPPDRGQSMDIRLPLPPPERSQNRDIKLHFPPPDRRKSNACVTVSVLAIFTVAVIVAVPLLFIYIFTEETPSTTGTVKLDLTLSDRFLADMADTSSSVFRSTELELSIEIEKAIKSYPDFPKDTFRECRLESLRNGSITASLVLTISGVFTIPDNNAYIMAITVYIGSVGTLGRYTVVPGSIVVTSATYTTSGTAVTVTSRPTTPSVTTTPYLPPVMEMNDSITAPGQAITMSCIVRYPPSDWEDFSIVSVDNADIHGRVYPNGTVVRGNSSYTVELQQNSEDMTLSIFFPNITTHCTARGNYLCTLTFMGSDFINATSIVIVSDIASGLTLEGNSTVEEGERYSINCSSRLATEGGSLDLYVKSANSSDFVRSTAIPTTTVGDVADSCYQSVTHTYDFIADADVNGTEYRCVATNDKLSTYQGSSSIDMVVDFADFSTNFHFQNSTWVPAYGDKNSPEFKNFAKQIENETDYIYSQSVIRDNYKKSKVTDLKPGSVEVVIAMYITVDIILSDGAGNQIHSKLTPTDIITALTDTIPLIVADLTTVIADLTGNNIIVNPGPETGYDCVTKTDVVFLLDASGSIGSTNFILMKYFIQNYTAGVLLGPDSIQVSVAKYSTYANNEFWLNEYHGVVGDDAIFNAIDDIVYTSGNTYIERGLNFVMNNSLTASNGARADASKVIILMTDGIAHDNPATAADILKREGVLIACVAIGNGIDYAQLQSIAYNDTYIFNAADFNVLAGIAATVKGSSCEIDNET